jgi:hypothetical protein
VKLKVYVVDLEIPPRAKRWLVRLGVPATILLGAAALAGPLHSWNAGDPLQASDLNANFANLEQRLAAVETQLSGSRFQMGSVTATGTDTGWTLQAGSGARDFRKRVSFDTAFGTVPTVSVGLQALDTLSGTDTRLRVSVESVDLTGFTLVIGTWADSAVYAVTANWLAYVK